MAKLNKWYRHISWIAQYVESVDVTKWPVSMLLACISMWNLHCATFSHSFHWRAMLWNAPHIQFSCNAFASFHEANLSMYCMILIGWRANCTLKMSERRASLTDTPIDQHGAISYISNSCMYSTVVRFLAPTICFFTDQTTSACAMIYIDILLVLNKCIYHCILFFCPKI